MTRAPWHGTAGGYANHACRCPACTEANRIHVAQFRASVRGSEPFQHGDSGYINWGCRCPACAGAHSATRRRQRDEKRRA